MIDAVPSFSRDPSLSGPDGFRYSRWLTPAYLFYIILFLLFGFLFLGLAIAFAAGEAGWPTGLLMGGLALWMLATAAYLLSWWSRLRRFVIHLHEGGFRVNQGPFVEAGDLVEVRVVPPSRLGHAAYEQLHVRYRDPASGAPKKLKVYEWLKGYGQFRDWLRRKVPGDPGKQ